MPRGQAAAELPAAAGLGAYLVTTAVLVVPMLGLARRLGNVPAGTVVVTVSTVALLGAALTSFVHLGPALGAIAGALVVELILTLTHARRVRLDVETPRVRRHGAGGTAGR